MSVRVLVASALVIFGGLHLTGPGTPLVQVSTQPEIDAVIAGLDADRAVVVPVSFMQEQSETLNELDRELRAVADQHGAAFHRVPVPDDDARFADVLAGVVEGRWTCLGTRTERQWNRSPAGPDPGSARVRARGTGWSALTRRWRGSASWAGPGLADYGQKRPSR